jgi:uncharacterized repeat protein (TIGR01451 family)
MSALLTILAVTAGGTSSLAGTVLFGAPQVVDSSPLADGGTSIAVQPTGQVHLGYQGATPEVMKYATNAYGSGASSWATTQTIKGTLDTPGQQRKSSSLAVDGAGNLHVCYYDSNLNGIMYATNRSGTWAVYPVEGAASPYSAIATDSDNRAHILMIDGGRNVSYRTSDALSASETLGDHADGHVQIVVDGDKHAHALYLANGGELFYATNASGSWVSSLVQTGVSLNTQMALCVDADGNAHAAYASATTLSYATNKDGAWADQDIPAALATLADAEPVAVFVTVGDLGEATIDWFSSMTGKVTRTSNASGIWENAWSESLAAAAGTTDAAIVVDESGNVHLACRNTAANQLVYVTNAAGAPRGADILVTQTRSPATVESLQQVQYTVTVTNLGREEATNVVLVDDLPAGTTFVSTTQGTYTTHQVTWTIASLPAGQADVTTITVTAPFRGTLVNLAMINSTQVQDFKTANNMADDSSNPLSIVPLEHPLVLSVADNVGGVIATAQPAQALYDEGSRVPVVATPDPGYQVQGWSGTVDDASTSNENEVEIGPGGSTTVQVRFEKIPRQLLVVAGTNGSINPLSGSFAHGDLITLTATPKRHYKVKRWVGTDHDDWTSNINLVTMDADRTVTVEFEPGSNQMPKAMASLPSVACPGDTVILDGTQSYDPDEDPLTYKWEANDVALNDSTSATASFTAPNVQEELIVEITLTVSDGQLGDNQVYVMKVQPAGSIGGGGCGGGAINPGAVVCMYSLCWLGLACMKWGPGRGRRGRPD